MRTILSLLILLPLCSFGQLPSPSEPLFFYEKGYVVTLENDTLRGELKVIKGNLYPERIAFRSSEISAKYKSDELLAFGHSRIHPIKGFPLLNTIDREERHYVSMMHPEKIYKKVFIERVLKGNQLNLFVLPTTMKHAQSGNGFSVESKALNYLLTTPDKKVFVVNNSIFEFNKEDIFTKCSAFNKWLLENPLLYQFKSLGILVQEYNQLCEKL